MSVRLFEIERDTSFREGTRQCPRNVPETIPSPRGHGSRNASWLTLANRKNRMNVSATTALAIYGAALSSIVFLWNLYRDLSNTGKLRVHCYIGGIIVPEGTIPDPNDYLVYSVTNVGRQPICVSSLGGSTNADSEFSDFILPPNDLPKKLEPGETFTRLTPDFSAINQQLKSLWVTDTDGKKHRASRKCRKTLIQKVEEMRKKQEADQQRHGPRQ